MTVNMGIVFGRPIEYDEDGRIKTPELEQRTKSDQRQKGQPDDLKPKRRVLPKANHKFVPRLFGNTAERLPDIDTEKPEPPKPKKPTVVRKPKERMVPKARVIEEPQRVKTRQPWPTIRVGTAIPGDFRIRITTARKAVLREWANDEMDEHGYTREQLAAVLGMTVGTFRNVFFHGNRTVMSSISLYDYLRAYYRKHKYKDRIIALVMERYTHAVIEDRSAEWEKLERVLEKEQMQQEMENKNGTSKKTSKD